MEIRKETVITPMTTDGKVLGVGDEVVFNATGRCFTGTFQGITGKGAIKIKGLITGQEVEFNIMPSSVECIYKTEFLKKREVSE